MPKGRKTQKSKTPIRNKHTPERNTKKLFDLMFKYILQEASPQAKIHFINGLFGKNFPPNTHVTLPNTESIQLQGEKLEHILSDFIILVSEEPFLIEVQIQDDANIALRIFEYSFAYSKRQKSVSKDGALITMRLPERMLLHWEPTVHTQDTVTFRLEQHDGTYSEYETPVYKVTEQSLDELERKGLALLLPFYLVKYRQEVKRNVDNSSRRRVIADEVEAITVMAEAMLKRACAAGTLTEKDSIMVMERIVQMHSELYGRYREFQEEQMRLQNRLRTQWQDYWERGIQEGVQKGIQQGRQEGVQEGIQQGRQEGVQEGIQRGKQEGRQEERAKIFELLKQGHSLEEVERLLSQE